MKYAYKLTYQEHMKDVRSVIFDDGKCVAHAYDKCYNNPNIDFAQISVSIWQPTHVFDRRTNEI